MDEASAAMDASNNFGIRKAFLISLITSLCISAIIAIGVFLFGKFGDIEFRLILTTLAVGGFSLTGLCSSILIERRRYVAFGCLGILVSATSFLYTLGFIWEFWHNFNNDLKTQVALIIIAASVAHTSLLLLVQWRNAFINFSLAVTLAAIVVVAAMLIYWNYHFDLFGSSVNDSFYRWLGVFAVLDALGTIVTPMLRKIHS